MTKTKIKDIIWLIDQGWRVYNAVPNSRIYDRLNCQYAPEVCEDGRKKRKNREPVWFVHSDNFVCIGCPRRCSLSRPEGFILPLPIQYEERKQPYTLTPAEMVQRKSLLRVDEVSYCLNISERTVYDWIAEGKLRRTEDLPVRVPSEDVAYRMKRLME